MIRIWDKKDLLSKVDDTIQNTKKNATMVRVNQKCA